MKLVREEGGGGAEDGAMGSLFERGGGLGRREG